MIFDFMQEQIRSLFSFSQQKPHIGKDWYEFSVQDTFRDLKTSSLGLSDKEAMDRRREYGPNVLPEEKRTPVIFLLFKQLLNPLVGILILAALISYFASSLLDVYVITAVIIINSVIGFVQEYRAEKSLRSLKKFIHTYAKVYRARSLHKMLAANLVPGDIVEIIAGDRIPADIRIITSHNFAVDQSALTGESTPQDKFSDKLEEELAVADQNNMAWMGTVAVRGKTLGVVVSTGTNTQIGSIAREIHKARRPLTVFQREIRRLSGQILAATLLLSLLIFILGVAGGREFLDMFMFTLAMMVSLIPEGLPAVISIVLAVGVYRMARRKAIVRNLASAETMGSVSIICTDKTGTITRNEMMVQYIATRNQQVEVSGGGFRPKGDFFIDYKPIYPKKLDEIYEALHGATMAVDAELEEKDGVFTIIGDPTEGALVVASEKASIKHVDLLRQVEESIAYPFDSKLRWGGNFFKFKKDSMYRSGFYVAGAPEDILSKSSNIYSSGRKREITKKDKEYFEKLIKIYSVRGLRVIAVARRHIDIQPDSSESAARELTFLGIFAMIDTPRAGVRAAIEKAKNAGVRVIMITGDHAETAWEIARQVGLIRDVNIAPILGSEIEDMTSEELREKLRNVDVLARVTPASKLRIVKALQEDGHIVAMTGDGVNDAPALRQADIGISMGMSGTDVAQDASAVILTDDDFSSIVSAIEEGRVILRNIRQATTYLISTNIGEALIIIVALLMKLPLPLLPVQILFLNLVTDGFSGVALSMEGNHQDTLIKRSSEGSRKPRILTRAIIPYVIITGFLMTIGTLPFFIGYLPMGLEKARTMAFVLMAFFQLWNILNLRSFKQSIFSLGIFSNIYVIGAIFFAIIAQLVVIYTEWGQKLFSVTPLSILEWVIVISVSSSIFIVIELWKLARRTFSSDSYEN